MKYLAKAEFLAEAKFVAKVEFVAKSSFLAYIMSDQNQVGELVAEASY